MTLTRPERLEYARRVAAVLTALTERQWEVTGEVGGDYVYVRTVGSEYRGFSLDYFETGPRQRRKGWYKVEVVNNNRRGNVALGRFQRSTPPQIRFSADADVTRAARAIAHRFLPAAVTWLQETLAARAAQFNSARLAAEQADRLVAASGGFLAPEGRPDPEATNRTLWGWAAPGTGESAQGIRVEANVSKGWCRLGLSGLTPEEAVELLKIVRGFKYDREMKFQDDQRRMSRGPASAESGEVR